MERLRPSAKLLLSTTNPGKARELRALLGGLEVEIVSLLDLPGAPEVEEDGETYADNARKKVVVLARWSGLPALADDSGLEVDALGGKPGVRSACYAGPQQNAVANRRKLLQALEGVEESRRGARFRCVIVVAAPDGKSLEGAGTCEGRIALAERGSGGFGYDPVFFYPPAGCTFAEMSEAAKNRVSHRARAVEALMPALRAFLDRQKTAVGR